MNRTEFVRLPRSVVQERTRSQDKGGRSSCDAAVWQELDPPREALGATGILAGKVYRRAPVFFVIGNPPQKITVGNRVIIHEPGAGAVANTLNGVIFLKIDALLRYSLETQVIVILEELVHAIMAVSDETLAKQIVCYILPGMSVKNEIYEYPAPPEG